MTTRQTIGRGDRRGPELRRNALGAPNKAVSLTGIFGNLSPSGPADRKQSARSRLQVRVNKLENIWSPDIRTTPAETMTFLRTGTECRVGSGFHGFAGLPDFLAQDEVGR